MNYTNKKTIPFFIILITGVLAITPFGFRFNPKEEVYVAEPVLVYAAALEVPQLMPETGNQTKELPDTNTPITNTVIPQQQAHLKIDKIGVLAVTKDMGLTPDGAMAVPGSRYETGLFSLGTRPGETGSAVIGGHNQWDSAPGVFARLHELEPGDIVTYVDAHGVATQFIVRDSKTYAATDPDSGIFSSESGAHLNLITCSGTFDPSTGTYTTRLVIFTDLMAS